MKAIFVHGLGQGPDSWEKTAASLTGHLEIHCPKLRALLSGKPATYDNLYAGFADCCQEAGEELHLCGLSLGGILALHYAMEYPDQVRSLAVMGVQCRMPGTLIGIQNLLFRLMPASSFQGMGFEKKELISLTRSMANLDLREGLSRISCPVLVLCGERDRANQKACRETAERIHGAELQMLPGAGHELNCQAPEMLAERLKDFYLARGFWGNP